MALLVAAMIACYAHRGTLSVAAPFMMKELNLSTSAMGILLSAFFWSYSFMQLPAGWMVDRYGVKRSYAVGYAFWSVAAAFTGFAHSLLTLVLLRMSLGIGQAVAFPASARAVAQWFHDRERGTVTATYLTGVRLGQASIALMGALFLARYGLKSFFLLTGIAPLLWLFPWYRFLGRWEEPPRDAASAVPLPSQKSVSLAQSLALLKQRSVLGIFLGFFAYDYAWFVYLTWLPSYLVMERGFSPREMGIYSAIPYVAMSGIILLSGLASDWLIRRGQPEIRVRKMFIIIGLMIGCLIVAAGMVDDKLTAVWLLTISLCGLGICSPNTWTLTQAVCSKNIVGTVSGIQNFGGNLGGVLAPALTGYIAHTTKSFALALTLAGGILVAGILSYCFLISQKVDNP
jgi:ACS family glucarate transporter-like MFS transporter